MWKKIKKFLGLKNFKQVTRYIKEEYDISIYVRQYTTINGETYKSLEYNNFDNYSQDVLISYNDGYLKADCGARLSPKHILKYEDIEVRKEKRERFHESVKWEEEP